MNWFWYLIGLLLTCQCFGVFAVCCSDLLDLAGECLVIFGLNETVKGNMLLAECKRGNLAVCIIHKMIYVFKSKAFLCYNQNFLVWGCFAKFLRSGMMLKFLNQAVFEFNFYCKICHKKKLSNNNMHCVGSCLANNELKTNYWSLSNLCDMLPKLKWVYFVILSSSSYLCRVWYVSWRWMPM